MIGRGRVAEQLQPRRPQLGARRAPRRGAERPARPRATSRRRTARCAARNDSAETGARSASRPARRRPRRHRTRSSATQSTGAPASARRGRERAAAPPARHHQRAARRRAGTTPRPDRSRCSAAATPAPVSACMRSMFSCGKLHLLRALEQATRRFGLTAHHRQRPLVDDGLGAVRLEPGQRRRAGLEHLRVAQRRRRPRSAGERRAPRCSAACPGARARPSAVSPVSGDGLPGISSVSRTKRSVVLELDARQRQRGGTHLRGAFVIVDGRVRFAQLAPALRALGHGLDQRAVVRDHQVVVAVLCAPTRRLQGDPGRSSRTPAGCGRVPSCSEPSPRRWTRRSGTAWRAARAAAPAPRAATLVPRATQAPTRP